MSLHKTFLFLVGAALFLSAGEVFAQLTVTQKTYCLYRNGERYTISEGIEKHGDDLAYVDFCCKELKVCRRHIDENGNNLSHVAAKANWTGAVDILVRKYNAPVESWRYGWEEGRYVKDYTQLMYAVKNNNFAMVKILIELGANATTKNEDGHDAKYFALNLKDGDKGLIDYIKTKWNDEMGYSELRIKENKDKLLETITLDKLSKNLAAVGNVADFSKMI